MANQYNHQDFNNWGKTPSSMEFTPSGYPIIQPVAPDDLPGQLKIKQFSSFSRNTDLDAFLMFYQEDHKFQRVWLRPTSYIDGIKKHTGAFSPDFSLYTDCPKPMQQWSHYKKQWCGAYWQSLGIKVIPTVGWSDENSYDFCFEGIPTESVVTVSASGIVNDKVGKELFIQGYNKMMEVLNPSLILFFSGIKLHKQLQGPIEYIGNTRWKSRDA
jgi:hypothetical protein